MNDFMAYALAIVITAAIVVLVFWTFVQRDKTVRNTVLTIVAIGFVVLMVVSQQMGSLLVVIAIFGPIIGGGLLWVKHFNNNAKEFCDAVGYNQERQRELEELANSDHRAFEEILGRPFWYTTTGVETAIVAIAYREGWTYFDKYEHSSYVGSYYSNIIDHAKAGAFYRQGFYNQRKYQEILAVDERCRAWYAEHPECMELKIPPERFETKEAFVAAVRKAQISNLEKEFKEQYGKSLSTYAIDKSKQKWSELPYDNMQKAAFFYRALCDKYNPRSYLYKYAKNDSEIEYIFRYLLNENNLSEDGVKQFVNSNQDIKSVIGSDIPDIAIERFDQMWIQYRIKHKKSQHILDVVDDLIKYGEKIEDDEKQKLFFRLIIFKLIESGFYRDENDPDYEGTRMYQIRSRINPPPPEPKVDVKFEW